MRVHKGFALDPSCVLYLPFYRYGKEQTKIWDASIQGSGPNMVLNGTFESGNPPTGWSTLFTPEVFERSATQKHSGSYSAHVNDSTASNGGFCQAQGCIIGKRYRVSFWYYRVSGTIQAYMYDLSWARVGLNVPNTWTYVEDTFIAGNDPTLCFINQSPSDPAEFYIDDVELHEVYPNNHGTITGTVPARTPLASPIELVSNGGMESGNPPTGWSAGSSPEVFEQSAVQKHSGSYSAHVNDSNPSGGGFVQTYSFTAGKRYRLSYWYYLVSGTILCGCDSAASNKVHTTTGSWQFWETIFIATTESYMVFKNNSGAVAAEFYIDDVSLREVMGYESLGWEFDGLDDTVRVPTSPSLEITSAISLIGWMRPMRIINSNTHIMTKYAAGNGFAFYQKGNDTLFQLEIWDAGVDRGVAQLGTNTLDAWIAIAATYNGSTAKIYKNGVLNNTGGTAGSIGNPNANDLYVGSYEATLPWRGNFGETLIFNRALSETEIKNYYEHTRRRYGV